MIGSLIKREIRNEAFFKNKGYKRYLNLISNILILGMVIALEVVIYGNVFDKVNVFEGFNDSLFIILEAAITLIGITTAIPMILKTFLSDKREKIILGTSPVTSYDIIFAKGLKIFLKIFFISLASFFVFGVVYGAKSNAEFIFYVLMFFNTIFISLFILGVGLLLAMPTHLLSNVIKKYKILSIVFTILAGAIIVTLYGFILNLFINLIRDSSLDKVFNTTNVAMFKSISSGLYPIKSMIDYALGNNMSENAFYSGAILISIGLISFFIFNVYLKKYYDSSLEVNSHNKNRNLNFKISTQRKALLGKEFNLALNNHDGIFSYLVLVLMQPFLVYGVVSSINLIFKTGNFTYVTTLFPAIFLTVDAVLILLFLSVINMTSSLNLNKEKDTLMIMKTIPVSFKNQLLTKILVTFIISFTSYLITLIVLISTKEISWVGFGLLTIIGALNIFTLNILSVFNDLKLKSNSSLSSLLLGFIFPIVIVLIGTGSTFLVAENYQELMFYGIVLALEIVLFAIMFVIFMLKANKLFIEYEGAK